MKEIYIGNGVTEYHLHSLSEDLPTIVHQGLEGLDNPTMRTDVYNNPGIRGQTVAQVLPGGSLITMNGSMSAPHDNNPAVVEAQYIEEKRKFRAAITHTYNSLGRAQPLFMRFSDQAGRELQVECFKDRFKAPLELPTYHEWMLQLINPSGVIESQQTKSVTVGLPNDGGVTFDLVWDIVFGDSTGGGVTATNEGDTEARPVIKLYGPLSMPRITNTITGEFMALNYDLLDGDVITIDTRNDTIIQGASTNRMGTRIAGSTMFGLVPGPNPLELTGSSFNSGYAEVLFRDTYEGV